MIEKTKNFFKCLVFILAFFLCGVVPSNGEELFDVDNGFNLVGPNNKITINKIYDPLVENVIIYYTAPKKGGVLGSFSDQKSNFNIFAVKVGKVKVHTSAISRRPQEVFKEKRNLFFKKVKILRFYDKDSKTLIYFSFSRKLVDGSPKNSISVIPLY